MAPAGLDPGAIAHAAASIGAAGRLHALTQRILADIDLHKRLDSEWRAWRQTLGRRQP